MITGRAEREMALNPPHLLDSTGQPSPGALIPFCAYNQAMGTLGKNLSGLTFPVCDQFRPVIKNGQVCYALSMIDVDPEKRGKTRREKESGLWLVINMEMSSKENFFIPKEFMMDKNTQRSQSASIHLSLLQEFIDIRDGAYGMTAMKKLTGTNAFLGLPDNVKDCQVEDQETCKNERFIEKVGKQCGCVPWSLGERNQAGNFCSPSDHSCVDNIKTSDADGDCRQSCTGLHAVVWHSNNSKNEEFLQKFEEMEEKYKVYLNSYAENVEYNSSSETLSKQCSFNRNTFNYIVCSSFSKRVSPIALGPVLLCASDLRRDRERQEVDS